MNIQSQVRIAVQKKTRRILDMVKRAEAETLKEAQEAAVKLSSGTYSLAALAGMGHPYARRHGTALLPPQIVNAQSGAFRDGWKTRGPGAVGNIVVSTIYNDSPAARWMKGTSKMVPRPILDAVKAQIQPARLKRLSSLGEVR